MGCKLSCEDDEEVDDTILRTHTIYDEEDDRKTVVFNDQNFNDQTSDVLTVEDMETLVYNEEYSDIELPEPWDEKWNWQLTSELAEFTTIDLYPHMLYLKKRCDGIKMKTWKCNNKYVRGFVLITNNTDIVLKGIPYVIINYTTLV
jgi:hypothetical protein